MFYIKYALKSLVQRRRQYISLFSVCTISVCIIVSLLSICDGMLKALNRKAVQYYGGELQLICGNRWNFENAENIANICSNMAEEMALDTICSVRFDYDASNVEFYFEGESVFCRMLKGVDFQKEKTLFECFTYTEGSALDAGYGNVLLSQPIANKLRCHAGDKVKLLLRTVDGYINSQDFVISGIFQDSSLFGMYTVYLDINSLREQTWYPRNFVNRITFFSLKKGFSKRNLLTFQSFLSSQINMAPIPKDKKKFQEQYNNENDPPIYALITLDANRPEVVMMSNALRLIVYLIIIPLVLIVAIGISCSYRVVILKRIVETSTFRALGLKARGVEKLFFTEVLMILLVGFIVGTGFSFAATAILGHFNFSFIPAFDLFLIGGRIKADYSFWKIIFVLFIIAFSTLTGVFVTLRNIIRLSPAKAFATTV